MIPVEVLKKKISHDKSTILYKVKWNNQSITYEPLSELNKASLILVNKYELNNFVTGIIGTFKKNNKHDIKPTVTKPEVEQSKTPKILEPNLKLPSLPVQQQSPIPTVLKKVKPIIIPTT